MKNAPKPNLSHVERGQAVLVLLPIDKKVVRATVQAYRHGEVRVRWRSEIKQYDSAGRPVRTVRRETHTFTVRRRDEGVTWCFDRDDETARSFQAAVVMA